MEELNWLWWILFLGAIFFLGFSFGVKTILDDIGLESVLDEETRKIHKKSVALRGITYRYWTVTSLLVIAFGCYMLFLN